jgi:hypothetical protein
MQPEPSCAQICASPTIGFHGLCQLMRTDQKNNLWILHVMILCTVTYCLVASFDFTPVLMVMIQIVYLTALFFSFGYPAWRRFFGWPFYALFI